MRFVRSLLLLAFLALSAFPAAALDFRILYYRIEDNDLANAIDALETRFEARERTLKEGRRKAAYGSPGHAEADRALEQLYRERDRAFYDALASGPSPAFSYPASASPGQRIQETRNFGGKPLIVDLLLGPASAEVLPLEMEIVFDGSELYKGTLELRSPAGPLLISKAFARIEGKRQGSMLFILFGP